MKPAHAPQAESEAPVRVEFQVQFTGGPKGRRRAQDETVPATPTEPRHRAASAKTSRPEPVKEISLSQVPKISRLLVLGHHFERLVRDGVVKDYADIARLTGLSRARVTQIANLTLLAPEIQDRILNVTRTATRQGSITERHVRSLLTEAVWTVQRLEWKNKYYYPREATL